MLAAIRSFVPAQGGVQARELIGSQAVPGTALVGTEILWLRAGMHDAHKYEETHAIGGDHLAAASYKDCF